LAIRIALVFIRLGATASDLLSQIREAQKRRGKNNATRNTLVRAMLAAQAAQN